MVTAIQGNVILAGESYEFALTSMHYGGMAAISLAVVAFFRFRPYYKYLLALTFLLGQAKIVSFTPTSYYFWLGSEESRLQLDLVAFVFGLLVYWTNASKINRAISGVLKPSAEKAQQLELVEIEEFKDRFSRKTTEELTRIVAANALVPSALAAARQLLKERS